MEQKHVYHRAATFKGYGNFMDFNKTEDTESVKRKIPDEIARLVREMLHFIDEEGDEPDLETLKVIIHKPGHVFIKPSEDEEILDHFTLGVRVEAHKKKEAK